MGFRTLGISNLDEGTLLSSWTEEWPLLVIAASQYVGTPMKHYLFHAPICFKGRWGKGLLRELHDLYQKQDKPAEPFFAFILRAPSTNVNASVTTKQLLANNIPRHVFNPRNKIERWNGLSEWREERLVRSVDRFLSSTAPSSIVRFFFY